MNNPISQIESQSLGPYRLFEKFLEDYLKDEQSYDSSELEFLSNIKLKHFKYSSKKEILSDFLEILNNK